MIQVSPWLQHDIQYIWLDTNQPQGELLYIELQKYK